MSKDLIGNIKKIENLQKSFERFEFICVNDKSSDDSARKVKLACEKIGNTAISIINMGYYHGVELSMNAGVDLSIGDFVFEFDTIHVDYDLSLVMDIYRHSLTGFDIVSATPINKTSRSSRLFYHLYNKNSFSKNKLKTERFRILTRRAINRVHSISKSVPYRKSIYNSCGLAISTIDYDNDTKRVKKSHLFWVYNLTYIYSK
jgi:dolichol-phosphate mannosyltransferase